MQMVWVGFLVWELRCHMLPGQKTKTWNRINIVTNSIKMVLVKIKKILEKKPAEAQSPGGFVVNETIPDKPWHFRVLCTRCVDDSIYQKPPSCHPSGLCSKETSRKTRRLRAYELLGYHCWRFRGIMSHEESPGAPQSSLVNSKTEEILLLCLLPQLLFPLTSIWPILLLHGQGQELVGNKKQSQRGWGGISKRWGCPPFLRHEEENQIHREWLLLLFRAILRWTIFIKKFLLGV